MGIWGEKHYLQGKAQPLQEGLRAAGSSGLGLRKTEPSNSQSWVGKGHTWLHSSLVNCGGLMGAGGETVTLQLCTLTGELLRLGWIVPYLYWLISRCCDEIS